MTILIENVLHQNQVTNIYLDKNRISYIGNDHKQADLVISGQNKVVLPTLVNGHTHAAMTLLRGYADDMYLQPWLTQKIWPLEAKLTESDVYWGAKLACLEMIKSGTTLFNDMYWHFAGTARAVEEMGIRAVLSFPLIDFGNAQKREEQRQTVESLYFSARQLSPRIQVAIAPHAIYTASPEAIRWAHQFAMQHNLMLHIHLSETEQEVKDSLRDYQLRPVEHLESLGVLGPHLVAAHCVWLNDHELDILQNRRVNLAHNPVANLKLAVGEMFRYPEIHQRGIKVCIGTDGCASNNNLDMFEQLKFAALLQKWKANDPTVLPCHEVWDLATSQAHQIFGVDAGTIGVGKLADLMLIDLRQPQLTPRHDIISNLVYAAGGGVVDTVICDGKILMQNHQVPGEEEIIAQSDAVARKLAGHIS